MFLYRRLSCLSVVALQLGSGSASCHINQHCSSTAHQPSLLLRGNTATSVNCIFCAVRTRMALSLIEQPNIELLNFEQLDERFPINKKDVLGTGKFGLVYRARDVEANRKIAVKFVMKDYTDLIQFKREFRYSLLFSGHPYIIQTYNKAFATDNAFFLCQELADRGTLYTAVLLGEIDQSKALFYLKGISLALDHVHSKGYVHRDVSPANIVLTSTGTSSGEYVAKLIDFGDTERQGIESTHQPIAFGGAQFSAPERLVKQLCAECPHGTCARYSVTTGLDIWSLGLITYWTLTKDYPWYATDAGDIHFIEFVRWQLAESSARSSRFWEGLSPKFNTFLSKLLSIDSQQRPSACEVYDYFEDMESSGTLCILSDSPSSPNSR